MPVSVGDKLGPYEILGPIGAGGMGEVYKARDTRLKRDVAIKVLPAALAHDAERMARFEREARLVASLDHPNIGAIYGLEENDGTPALILALIEGPTLADRIEAGPLPQDEAITIAKQIIEALEYAHDKGVVHRDLKPANVKISPEGVVKVLDFGLAKVLEDERPQPSGADSPTLTLGRSQAGVILGTAAYMSPEQAVGKRADRRSDIFSFGVVLYEMLTGIRPFAGDTAGEMLVSVAKDEPDWSILTAAVPAPIRKLLRRCLVKDRKQRLQAIGEARIAIESKPEELEPASPALAVNPSSRFAWMVAGIALLAALGLGWLRLGQPTETPRLTRTSLVMPERAIYNDYRSLPAISPDGRRIAISLMVDGKRSIWVRDLESLGARPLSGTDEGLLPFWSPDSRVLGYFTLTTLKKIDAGGGPSLTVCDVADGVGGTWNQNDVIVYGVSSSGLFRVSASGGTPTPIVELDRAAGESSDRNPWFLPDGMHFLYTARSITNPEKSRVRIADVNATPTSNAKTDVVAVDSNAVYVPPGLLLYMRETTLVAQPFDAGKARITGDAVPIAEQVNFSNRASQGLFSVSGNGALVYASAAMGGATEDDATLLWFNRSGKDLGTLTTPLNPYIGGWSTISPGGQTIALSARDGQARGVDIWMHDLARGATSRFTFGPGSGRFPVWSPDGSQLAFEMRRPESADMYKKAVSGVGQMEIVSKAQADHHPDDWSPDGRYIVEQRQVPKHGWDIWIVPMIGDEKEFPYLQTEFNETNARLSPNGLWLAYQSDESKRTEIYAVGFPKPVGKWQISSGGGTMPAWSRDGRELYFLSAERKMMAVGIGAGTKFEPGVPKPLFETRAVFYDVGKDGRFLMTVPSGQTVSSAPLTAVFNWQGALKKP
jgi:serine/threonine protein kinase